QGGEVPVAINMPEGSAGGEVGDINTAGTAVAVAVEEIARQVGDANSARGNRAVKRDAEELVLQQRCGGGQLQHSRVGVVDCRQERHYPVVSRSETMIFSG